MRAVLDSLHFRIAALFLALLTLMFLGYSAWVERTVYGPDWVEGEMEWYDLRQAADMDSLAALLSPRTADSDFLQLCLDTYGPEIDAYDVEMAVASAFGHIVATTERDTLAEVVRRVSPELLARMSQEDWDFGSYPDPDDMDSYVNRITSVRSLRSAPLAPERGWLIATFRPLAVDLESDRAEESKLALWTVAAALAYSFIVGLVLLAWVTRRVRTLSDDMARFRDGDFSQRTHLRGSDEIARLGSGFNSLADRLSSVISELKQSEEYRTQLVANISHDLRTPMATLRSYVESFLLRWEELPAEDRERQLGVISSNLDSLDGLVARLFELTQLESERADLHPEPFCLEELTDDVLRRLEVKATEVEVALALEAEPDLPPVNADPVRIAQVLQNLVDNAVKFNRKGGTVVVELHRRGDRIGVAIRDTGVGIADADLPHVFERFYTGDESRAGAGRGSGLGLAIAHRIVHAHGGELTVASRPGEGAVFRFDLPTASDPG